MILSLNKLILKIKKESSIQLLQVVHKMTLTNKLVSEASNITPGIRVLAGMT